MILIVVKILRYALIIGFSFGGILAHLCATHLWSLSQGICPELLEKNLLCVTFGQPVISLPSTTNFAKRIADKTRFHAVYIPEDIIPRMMRYMDAAYTDLADRDLPDRFRSKNNPNEVYIPSPKHVEISIISYSKRALGYV